MHWKFTVQKLDELDAAERIYWPSKAGGMPQYKRYRDELKGLAISDLWDDVDRINPVGGERLGYPTQKPVALLERILAASSNEGDVVLDPFCGCGTTIHAAQRLKRQWIGIDVTHLAISLIESRLVAAFPGIDYELLGTPKDLAGAKALAERSKHQFEWWALSLVKAQPANDRKKGADKGIDGLMWVRTGQRERAKVVVSVKGGYNINVQMVRDLWGVIEREKAAAGLFVTLHEPTRPMIVEAAKAGFYEVDDYRFPRIQILTVEELLGSRKPDLPLVDHAALVKRAQVDPVRAAQPAFI
jgi:site-specific DNA-methyltransferase (adenine-specific)